MKKIIAMILVIVLCCAVSVGLTVAYLTDRDSAANIFTVGNVAIDLTEDFEQGAMLIPGVKIEKEPSITNIGNIDAWVWATVAIPAALDNDDASKNVVHFNYDKNSVNEDEWVWQDANGWMVDDVEIDGVDYKLYTILYQTALKPGETTKSPFMTQVYLDTTVDIAPNGDWYKVVNGVATKLDWNSNNNGSPIFYVSAYAIQKDTFETVQAAYAAYQTQWGENGTEYGNVKVVTPDTATRPAGYIPADGETIENLVIIDNSPADVNLRALYTRNGDMNGNLTVKDSYLDGTYAMNVTVKEEANAELVCENTAFLGWVSYAGWKTATFTGCTFQINTNPELYNVIRPYDNTTFTGCEFKGTELYTDKLAAGDTITLVDCTFNGELITDASVLVAEGHSAAQVIIANTSVAP